MNEIFAISTVQQKKKNKTY